jgi:hypothetical protein
MPKAPDWSRRVPARSPRDPEPSARVRRLVFARAFGRCESCGTSVIGRPYSIQPRVADAAAGGSSRAEASDVWNLTLLCGSAASPGGCHRRCQERDQDLYNRGIWLWPEENPRLAPVLLVNPDGPRVPAWLNDDGTYDFEPPAGDRVSRGAARWTIG